MIRRMYRDFWKGVLDFGLSFLAIVALLPFFLIFTPIVAIAMRGNPFFVQKRPGRDTKVFPMIKYRTMTNAKDKEGNLLPDEIRLTKFGQVMRRLSIDELPELLNILAGQMSLVGPRPLLVSYLPLYTKGQARRHEVRPGLTGFAQVSGRNAIGWDEKFEKDVYYVDHIGFFFDLKILLMTVVKVFQKEGISQEGRATMEAFKGSEIPTDDCQASDLPSERDADETLSSKCELEEKDDFVQSESSSIESGLYRADAIAEQERDDLCDTDRISAADGGTIVDSTETTKYDARN